MKQKFIFELTRDEIKDMCVGTRCDDCQLNFNGDLCAKDLQYTSNDMRSLLTFLLREVHYDNLRVVKKQSRTEGSTGESKEKNADVCKE